MQIPRCAILLYLLAGLLASFMVFLEYQLGGEVAALSRPEPRATMWHVYQVHHYTSRLADRASDREPDAETLSRDVEVLLAQVDAVKGYGVAELHERDWKELRSTLARVEEASLLALGDMARTPAGSGARSLAAANAAQAFRELAPVIRRLSIETEHAINRRIDEHRGRLARLFQGTVLALALLVGTLAYAHWRMLALQSAQEELQQKRRVADEANLAKSRFLGAASHELRQPVHALNLYVNMLAASPGLPEHARVLAKNAQLCGQAADDMFRSLLDWSRLEAATWPVEVEEFPVGCVLDAARLQFTPQARIKGLQLRIYDTAALARSDPRMVERIVHNFVSNAVRYSTQGRIVVGCRRRPGGMLRIAVHDTGPGIPPDQHDAIFREFYQVSRTQPDAVRGPGLGLGLATAKRLAALLDVRIVVSSVPGKGSMFAIDVPEVPLDTAEIGLQPAHSPATASPAYRQASDPSMHPALNGMLVLVIDNEATICQAMGHQLAQWGCEAITATSLHEAFVRLGHRQRPPDLVICDYWLGEGVTGLQAIRQTCQEFGVGIPALLITGDTSPARLREIKDSGTLVLLKPFSAEELREAVLRLRNPSSA